MLITLPANAMVEFCDSSGYNCVVYKESCVKTIETTITPNYGINVITKDGHKNFVPADTRSSAVLMLEQGLLRLKKYYNWSNGYYYNLIDKQDKAGLRIK
jgi:hypothetical protein